MLICIAFEEGIARGGTTLSIIGGVLTGCAIGWTVHEVDEWSDGSQCLHEKEEKKNMNEGEKRPVYAPDKPLSRCLKKNGMRISDTDAPHYSNRNQRWYKWKISPSE